MKRHFGLALIALGVAGFVSRAAGVPLEPDWLPFAVGFAGLGIGAALARRRQRPWTYRDEALHRILINARSFR